MDELSRSPFEQAAFDDAPIAMALVSLEDDGERIIRSANGALAELVGRSTSDLVGRCFRELTHRADHDGSDRAAPALRAESRTEFHGRQCYQRPDGDDVWVDVYTRLVGSPNTARFALVHILDAGDRVKLEHDRRTLSDELEAEVSSRTALHAETERRLRLSLDAERDLLVESQEQQQRLDVSLRAARMGTCELNFLTDRVSYDDRAGEILGLGDETTTNAELLDIVSDLDREQVAAAVGSAIQQREPCDAVFRIDVGVGAQPRWVHGWGQPIEDETGVVRKIVGVLQDVTEERQARRRIEEREERLKLVLDATVTGVFDWDLRRQSITFSDNWFDSIGFASGDLDTRPWAWERIVHPDDWPGLQRLIEAHVEAIDAVFSGELRLRCKDGTWRWARITARAVDRDDLGRAQRVIGAETDISDQRLLEQQLVHSAKMQSLGEFAGGIAHDFNNVMAIVRGHTEFLLRRDAAADDIERRLTSIDRAVDRASSLVRELMLLGRPATDNPVVVDLTEHIRATATSWPTFLGDDVLLSLDLSDEPVPVRIDVSRLDAVLLNIAANSRDAMPDGGSFRITLRRRTSEDGTILAIIEMTDDGIGMDDATLMPLFDPFFTTKAPGVGTGLGLATSYTTVNQAGGTIVAESDVGVGTTISISLPIVEPSPRGADERSQSELRWTPRASILVVEDEAEILELNADVLRLAGHRVFEALNGHEALEILGGGAEIDLLLTDAVMPGMSGPQLVSRVRRHVPNIRVLYLSGYAEATHATEAIEPNELLTKPISSDDLVRAVSVALQREG